MKRRLHNDCDRETSSFRKLALGAAAFGLSSTSKVFPENRHGDFSHNVALFAGCEPGSRGSKSFSEARRVVMGDEEEEKKKKTVYIRFTRKQAIVVFYPCPQREKHRSIVRSFERSRHERPFLSLFFFFGFFGDFFETSKSLVGLSIGSPCWTKAGGVIAKTYASPQIVYHLHENT